MSDVKVEWFGDKLPDMRAVGRSATRLAGERLKAVAIPRTPVDTGNLRASYQVVGINAEATTLVRVNAHYGVYQHEAMDWHHDDGEAKFLERSLNDNRAVLLAIIAEEVRGAIAAAG